MLSDDELRAALHRLAPPVEGSGAWEALHKSPTPNTPARRRTPQTRKILLAAAVVVAIVGALGLALKALVEQVDSGRSVVVFTDGAKAPGTSLPTISDHPGLNYGNAEEQGWATLQITRNTVNDEVPVAQGDLLVWRAYDGHDYEIMLYDFETVTTTQLTHNQIDDWEPKVYGNHVAWMEGSRGGPWTLRLYDVTTGATREIADGTVNYGQYELDGDLLVWPHLGAGIPDVKVLNLSTGEVQTIAGWGAQTQRVFARTDGRYILIDAMQQETGELLLYDTRTATQKTLARGEIADDWRYLDDRRLADGAVVWSASDGHDDEIFLYDIVSDTTTQLTNNEVSDTEPEVGRGHVLWARSSLQSDGQQEAAREVVLYERSSGQERILGQGYGRLAEDGELAIWSEYPQKAEHLWVYDIALDEATNLEPSGSGASWPDVVDGRVVWYSEQTGAQRPTAEVMIAARNIGATASSLPSETTLLSPEVRIGVMIPFCMLYQGRLYTCTDQAIETTNDTPTHVSLLGSGLSALDENGVVDPGSPQYDMYAIKGTDQEKAIAVKFQGIGSSGPIWVWLKYERKK